MKVWGSGYTVTVIQTKSVVCQVLKDIKKDFKLTAREYIALVVTQAVENRVNLQLNVRMVEWIIQ